MTGCFGGGEDVFFAGRYRSHNGIAFLAVPGDELLEEVDSIMVGEARP